MSKLEVKAEDGKVTFNVDANEDGQPSLHAALDLTEGVQEAIKRGEAVEGAKVVEFKFELTKLVLKIDTDRDNEKVLELEIDLAEAFDEVSNLIKK